MEVPEWTSFLSIVDASLNPVPLQEAMAKNRGLDLLDLKKRSPEHTSAELTGCESYDNELVPAIARDDADDQLSRIASSFRPVVPSCVDLKHTASLAEPLLEEVDLGSTSAQRSLVGKPVLHMQLTCSGESAGQNTGAVARPPSNNMPLSEHDAQELRKMLYLRAEGIQRQERLQCLKQTWKSSIWSEEDDEQ